MMRVISLAAVLTVALGAGQAGAALINFEATLDCAAANAGLGTCVLGGTGTGFGTFVLNDVTGQVDFNITFSGLSAPELFAHVHGPALTIQNAGVIYGLPLGAPKIGATVLGAPQIVDMIAELHYVNIHSTAFPGGEIRGQILRAPVPEPSALLLVGLGLAGAAAMRRRIR